MTSHNDLTKPINLENSGFRLGEVIGTSWEPNIDLFHKEKWVRLKDFGTILIGRDPFNAFNRRACNLDSTAPIFLAPESWRMPQVLKALGAFASAGDAARNGWNKDIDSGMSQHVFKLNRILGCITIFKVVPGLNPNPLDEEENE